MENTQSLGSVSSSSSSMLHSWKNLSNLLQKLSSRSGGLPTDEEISCEDSMKQHNIKDKLMVIGHLKWMLLGKKACI